MFSLLKLRQALLILTLGLLINCELRKFEMILYYWKILLSLSPPNKINDLKYNGLVSLLKNLRVVVVFYSDVCSTDEKHPFLRLFVSIFNLHEWIWPIYYVLFIGKFYTLVKNLIRKFKKIPIIQEHAPNVCEVWSSVLENKNLVMTLIFARPFVVGDLLRFGFFGMFEGSFFGFEI